LLNLLGLGLKIHLAIAIRPLRHLKISIEKKYQYKKVSYERFVQFGSRFLCSWDGKILIQIG